MQLHKRCYNTLNMTGFVTSPSKVSVEKLPSDKGNHICAHAHMHIHTHSHACTHTHIHKHTH